MTIKILGGCCQNCGRLEDNVRQALEELGLKEDIIKVTDPGEVAGFGILSTPALVINGKVAFYGRVPSIEDIKKIFLTSPKND